MPIAPGAKFGPYEILSPAGVGGMGEVYKARDTRLDRTVAIKVLTSNLASDATFRERFDREARTVSSLQHPHICVLHDIGEQEGVNFLVMEYLEGETLADRLAKGPLPAEQVLRYATEIADALDRAHQAGIVHRDLKPGNVMLTKAGAKVLDFGLAKGGAPAMAASAMTAMVTQTKPLTAEGSIVGTFQYMAPETLEGREADARSDIFSFGALVYEMLTGKRAFSGKTQASVIAAVLASEPAPISSVQPMTPPALDRLVRTCLSKDPDERFHSAHDLVLQLRWIADAGSQAGIPAPVVVKRKYRERIAWALASLMSLAAIAFAVGFWLRTPQPGIAVRAAVMPPKDQVYDAFSFALSPDGKRLVFVATDARNGKSQLWVRPLNAASAQELTGTEDAEFPFWSPDSKSIGFFAQGKLRRIDAGGGPVLALADAPGGRGGSWSSTGVIIFSRTYTGEGLYRVPETGGPASEATAFGKTRGEDSHRFPFFLPDGQHFLFYISSVATPSGSKEGDTVAGVYLGDLKSTTYKYLLHTDSNAQFGNGYMFYLQQQNLMAQPFNPSRGEVTAPPVPVAQHVRYNSDRWVGAFSVSSQGVLSYLAGEQALRQLQWFSRDGKPVGVVGTPGVLGHPALSPDGHKVAVSLDPASSANRDIWIYELERGNATRLTFNDAADNIPIWSSDGSRVAYANDRNGYDEIYVRASTGLGDEELLTPSDKQHDSSKQPSDWTPDGRSMLYTNFGSGLPPKLWIHDTTTGKGDYPLLKTNSSEAEGKFSPDGHWLSYTSEETGRPEIYVVPYPGLNGKWQVSTTGGSQARWRKDGKEIVFVTPEGNLMSAAVSIVGNSFRVEAPKLLFATKIMDATRSYWQYDMTGDAQKFLINTRMEQAKEPITLYANWPAELKP
jgi:Tol biopolymer transport system component